MAAVYIGKNNLKSDLLIPKPDTQWQDGYISAMDVARKEADFQPTADVVEREKIDKTIEEITELISHSKLSTVNMYNRYSDGLKDCLDILRRNIGESK